MWATLDFLTLDRLGGSTLFSDLMRTSCRSATIPILIMSIACSESRYQSGRDAAAGIDSLNARIVEAYRTRDPKVYGTLFTDSALFEWPAFNTVRGRAGMEAMARGNWAGVQEMDLRLIVASRRVASDHAMEFGAFEQSWRDSAGTRMTEFGRYVTSLARQPDGRWLIDRFFGFADSTRPVTTRR